MISNNKRIGFSLIELMVVIAIVAILAAIVVPSYKLYMANAKTASITSVVGSLINKSMIFAGVNGHYPNAYELGLRAGAPNNFNLGNAVDNPSSLNPYFANTLMSIMDYGIDPGGGGCPTCGCGQYGTMAGSISPGALGIIADNIWWQCDLWHHNGTLHNQCSYSATRGGGAESISDNIIPGWVNQYNDTAFGYNPEYLAFMSGNDEKHSWSIATCMGQ